ncbi:U4/U6.U5 small nuclear ribonucleoprotein 27 kDa protein [Hondaea fermentalgiana]|uniref:U4/U6.U5 small nuclear ribonucleoprotein 27 kDa protein n=1 Tax=Hondaea fermentalgiana TaxID=2315210 RepID=A0A2R5G3Q1_9STRA|nr:U4/U6.U5 small nuclear ribonucleoprotein 27 kDa protein [Hondaea fermentalgiana]|eukprot:GBG25642.1 U4/U6.U5 small nuclear ribonucleoprotein 27 kDa protein [Hondaea fermentalgiana]
MERRRETYSPDRHSRKRDRRDRRRDEDGNHEEDQDRRRHSRRRDEEDYDDRRYENEDDDSGHERGHAEENVEVDEFGRVVTKERKIAANMTQEEKMQGMSEEEQMKMLLGITSFDSTKEKVVEDNQRGPAKGAAALNKKRKFRQYMNRKGGFNRSLDN